MIQIKPLVLSSSSLFHFCICSGIDDRHSVINKTTTLIGAIVLPVVMGGLIEIVQATCTGGNRSGDVTDWLADAVGVALGQLIGIPLATWLANGNKAK